MSPYSLISKNKQKTILLITLFIFFFSFCFYLLGLLFNNPLQFLFIGFIASLFSSFSSYWWSDRIILRLTNAKAANKKEHFDLYTVTENLSLAAGLPMPKLYVIEDQAPNAFATGRDPKHAVVVVTTGLLKILDRSDLEGVVAHELSHIKNFDILLSTIVAILIGIIGIGIDFALRTFWYTNLEDKKETRIRIIFFIIFSSLAYLIANLIRFAISRQREYLADSSAVLITRNPQGLIDALKKISQYPKQVKVSPSLAHLFFFDPLKKTDVKTLFVNLFSTHPPVEKRIEALKRLM